MSSEATERWKRDMRDKGGWGHLPEWMVAVIKDPSRGLRRDTVVVGHLRGYQIPIWQGAPEDPDELLRAVWSMMLEKSAMLDTMAVAYCKAVQQVPDEPHVVVSGG